MVDISSIAIGAAVTGTVGYATYSYRNTIACTLTSIAVRLPETDPHVKPDSGIAAFRLTAERLEIKNNGFRNLVDVEIHVPIFHRCVYSEVIRTSSISSSAVKLESDENNLRVIIPKMPRKEEVRVHFATRAGYMLEHREVKGTGGPYRVVEGRRYDAFRQFIWTMSLAIVLFIINVIIPITIRWLSTLKQ